MCLASECGIEMEMMIDAAGMKIARQMLGPIREHDTKCCFDSASVIPTVSLSPGPCMCNPREMWHRSVLDLCGRVSHQAYLCSDGARLWMEKEHSSLQESVIKLSLQGVPL
jgi:hypothetical protein